MCNVTLCFVFPLQCMMWSWYLASDVQFYTIAPVILFIAYWYELMIQHNPSMELSR